MIQFIAGFLIGAISCFFAYAAGIDEGFQRSYRYCVEQQAQKQMLSEARVYCGAITGRSDLRRKQRLE